MVAGINKQCNIQPFVAFLEKHAIHWYI